MRAAKTAKSQHPDISLVGQSQDSDLNQDRDEEGEGEEEAFDIHRLHVAYRPKMTEALIKVLFNPVRTSEKRRESLFTYYEPKAKKDSKSKKKPVGLGLTLPDSGGEGSNYHEEGRLEPHSHHPTSLSTQ